MAFAVSDFETLTLKASCQIFLSSDSSTDSQFLCDGGKNHNETLQHKPHRFDSLKTSAAWSPHLQFVVGYCCFIDSKRRAKT